MIRRWTIRSFAGTVLLLSCSAPPAPANSDAVAPESKSLFTTLPQSAPTALSPAEYVEWINDPENNLVITKELNGIRYELKYTPSELIALRQLVNQGLLSPESFRTEKLALEKSQYYTLSIGTISGVDVVKAGTRSEKEREDRLDYFSSKMQSDVFLIEGIDTMRCNMYQFENLSGLSSHSNFILAFPVRESRKNSFMDKTFLLQDITFANGLVDLEIKGEHIKNIPLLDIKTEE